MTSRKDDIGFHYVLKQAAIYSYRGNNSRLPHGYRVIESVNNNDNGFYADVLSDGDNIIIAYRGTEISSSEDLENDYYMLQKKLPMQTIDALQLYDRMARVYPNKTISLTGHSLGGSLAEIVSGIRGAFAVTFNAYGIRDMFKSGTILKEDNIVNYVNEADLFTMVNGKNHIGEIYAIPNLGRNWLEKHFAEYMGVLSQRQKRSSKQIEVTAHRLHPKPLTSKEMLSGEAKDKLSNMLQGQKQKINNKFQAVKNTLQQNLNSECVGSYPVSGYTREDGTKVNGYTRTCGAKHNN